MMRSSALLFLCVTLLFSLTGCGIVELSGRNASPISQAEASLTEELGLFRGLSAQSEEALEIEVDGKTRLYYYPSELSWKFTEWIPEGTKILFTYMADAEGRLVIQSVDFHLCGEECPH